MSRDVSRPVFTSLGLGPSLEPRSLGLGLGLGTWDHGDLRNSDPWVEVAHSDGCKVLHSIARKKTLLSAQLPPLLLWNGYLATVVC